MRTAECAPYCDVSSSQTVANEECAQGKVLVQVVCYSACGLECGGRELIGLSDEQIDLQRRGPVEA